MCGGGGCGSILGAVGSVVSMVPGMQWLGMGMTVASKLFGSNDKSSIPNIPTPAAPAPVPRANGGANVQVGTDTSANRVGGAGMNPSNTAGETSGNVLGSLGRGGLAI